MMKVLVAFIMSMPLVSLSMEPVAMREQTVKRIVRHAIEKIKHTLEHTNSVAASPLLIQNEIDAGALYMEKEKGYLCADGKIFIVDLAAEKLITYVQMPGRIECVDHAMPAVSALICAQLVGADRERILLGEDKGRIVIVDPYMHEFKTFGHIDGKILSFICHPAGNQIAVRYTAKDSEGLAVPCFALSVAYLKKLQSAASTANRRRSWNPGGNWEWTEFLVKPCQHEVRKISFDGEDCLTECATGTLEQWRIENPEQNPQLVLVAQRKIRE